MAKQKNRDIDSEEKFSNQITASEKGRLAILQQRSAILSKIEEREKKIQKILSESTDDAEKYNRLTEDALKINEEILKDRKELEGIEKRINEYYGDNVDLAEKEVTLQKKIEKTFLSQKAILDKKNTDSAKAQELMVDAQERLTDASKGWAVSQDITLSIMQNQQYTALESKRLLTSQKSLSDAFLENLEDQEDVSNSLVSTQQDITKSVAEASTGQYTKLDLSRQQEMIDKRSKDLAYLQKDIQDGSIDMTMEEYQILLSTLEADKSHLQNLMDQNQALSKASEESKKVLGTLDKVLELDIKGAIREGFGLDNIQKGIREKVGMTFVNMAKEMKSGNGLVGALKAAGSGMKGLLDMAPMFIGALGITALMGVVGFLVSSFGKLDEEVSKLGKEFGVSKNEAKELHHAAVDVANEMKVTGIHSEEIAKSLKTVSDNLGGIDLTGAFVSGNAQVQQMVKDTTLLTEKFGLSAEEAGNLSNIAAISGKSVGEMSMMASTLGKGIFSAKESMKILAGIPKSIVSSMSKMPEAMIKTAMHAKMLGMDMKQIADIGRKSLDIEQSLEKEMEARVLLGREINLDKMRAAALDGDQETVMKELLNAAGSMDDFNKMNVIQKEALAKAANMEVDQLAEMLGKQEELNKAGLSQSKIEELQQKNATELASIAANTNDANKKAYLEKLAAEKKSEETQAAMADLMKRLQELAVKLVTPILDVVDGLLQGKDGANAMDGIFNVVSKTVKTIVPIIKFIAEGIGMIIKPLTWILGLFSSTEDQTEAIAKTTGTVSDGIAGVTDKVKPLTAGFGNVLGIVTAIGGFFAGKALLGKGLDVLKGKVGDLGSTLVSKVGGPLGKIGGKLFGGGKKEESGSIGGDKADVGEAEKGKNMVSGILDKMKSIIDSIKGVVQSAIGFVRDVGKDLLATLNDIVKGIGDILKTGADIIVNVGTTLAEGAMKILNIIMNGLASAAEKLPTIMGALGKAVVAFFEPMAALVNPMVIGGILIFTGTMIGLAYAFKLLGEGIGAAAPGITAFFDGVGGVIKTVGEAIAKVIETITTSVIRLQDIDGGKMTKAALGIYAIAGALAAFGGGSFIAGLGAALGKLFDEDPVDKFNRFATIDAKSLDSVAKAILTLAQAMQTFSNISSGLNLDKVDQMVESIEKLKDAQTSASISDLGTKVVGGLTSFVGNIFGSSEKQTTQPVGAGGGSVAVSTGGGGTNMANVEKKLDTLISVISQAANQPLVIKFGEKTVEEIKSQLNFKAATSIGVNNKTYAKTI
jgi:hypothetical protein